MKINGRAIANVILGSLQKKAGKLRPKPTLAIFLVNPSEANIVFVKTKKQAAGKIKGLCELIYTNNESDFEEFANHLKKVAHDSKITGVVIQQPLPASLSTDSLYDYIPLEKEIEGHKKKSYFTPPIGLAVFTILKYIYKPGNQHRFHDLIFDMKKDRSFLKKVLKRKKIVLLGRGGTGGRPIAKVLTEAKINFINLHSQTPDADFFEREADIIISAVGKKVITPEVLKPGVILISVGIRKENGVWKGDYDEEEIKNIASFYTPTPGGVGPLDIAYLMYNLVEATKMQL